MSVSRDLNKPPWSARRNAVASMLAAGIPMREVARRLKLNPATARRYESLGGDDGPRGGTGSVLSQIRQACSGRHSNVAGSRPTPNARAYTAPIPHHSVRCGTSLGKGYGAWGPGHSGAGGAVNTSHPAKLARSMHARKMAPARHNVVRASISHLPGAPRCSTAWTGNPSTGCAAMTLRSVLAPKCSLTLCLGGR